MLEIDPDNTGEDVTLLLYAEQATSIMEEFLGRDVSLKGRTQYYSGNATQKLPLKFRPVYPVPTNSVYPTISVTVDGNGYCGAGTNAFTGNPLTYGVDYFVQLDSDYDNDGIDEASRSGLLIRINDYWERPFVRQWNLLTPFLGSGNGNIKVVYSAGWTIDSLPAAFRLAGNLLVSKLRWIFPLGLELSNENYIDRGIGIQANQRDYLLNLIKPILTPFRNWAF